MWDTGLVDAIAVTVLAVLALPFVLAGVVYFLYWRWLAGAPGRRDAARYAQETAWADVIRQARFSGDYRGMVESGLLTVGQTYETDEEREWDTSRLMALGFRSELYTPMDDGSMRVTWVYQGDYQPLGQAAATA